MLGLKENQKTKNRFKALWLMEYMYIRFLWFLWLKISFVIGYNMTNISDIFLGVLGILTFTVTFPQEIGISIQLITNRVEWNSTGLN